LDLSETNVTERNSLNYFRARRLVRRISGRREMARHARAAWSLVWLMFAVAVWLAVGLLVSRL
jgi:hypothetical protein